MIQLIKTPNLPQGKVKHCLIGEKYIDEINELKESEISCITLKENHLLDFEISAHADVLCFNFGNGQVIVNSGSIGESELKKLGINPIIYDKTITSPYPYDVPLNAAYIGDYIVCNPNHTAKDIISFVNSKNKNLIKTKQGYSRCNICVVNEKAVITEDKGIAHLLKNYQFDILTISSGDVYLSECHHGFLGGASCKLSKEKIYFSGNIKLHRDYENIVNFLNKHQVEPIYNKNRKLRDFGGIIQLTEEI